jgi:hypothetical protein
MAETVAGWLGAEWFDVRKLIAWLAWQEFAEILADDVLWPNGYGYPPNPNARTAVRAAVVYMYTIFTDSDGISPTDLSTFTAFYNPERDSVFDSQDWDLIMTTPDDVFFRTVDTWWGNKDPRILVWRDPKLPNEPSFRVPLVVVKKPKDGPIILEFGYK